MRKLFSYSLVLCVGLFIAPYTHAERVLTIYFAGTGAKSTWFEAAASGWGSPELLASLYEQDQSSADLTSASIHYKRFVNGLGTDEWSDLITKANPNFGERGWKACLGEGEAALAAVLAQNPGENVILNLVGWSRGGVLAMWMARSATGNDRVSKINVLAFDPVPGLIFNTVEALLGKFVLTELEMYQENILPLSSKVNQFVGIYAEDERSYKFEPIIPSFQSGDTARWLLRVRGSHETLVGNPQVDGHGNAIPFNWSDSYDGLLNVSEISRAIAQELLISSSWGSVPFAPTDLWSSGFANPEARLVQLIDLMNGASVGGDWMYMAMPMVSFIGLYGGYDTLLWPWRGQMVLQITAPPPPNRLCFVAPYYSNYPFNHDRVFWMKDFVPLIDRGTAWTKLRELAGTAAQNRSPVASCRDLTVNTDAGACVATVNPAQIDAGSSDPDGDVPTLELIPPGPYVIGANNPVILKVTDPQGLSDTCEATITVLNSPPAASQGGRYTVTEGASVDMEVSGSDPEGSAVKFAWDLDGDGTTEITGQAVTVSAAELDGPNSYKLKVRVTDACEQLTDTEVALEVLNAPPVLTGIIGPNDPVLLGSQVTLRVSYTDPGVADTHMATYAWGDGTTTTVAGSAGSASASHLYSGAGIYSVTITVTDDDGDSAEKKFEYVVVYDPEAGCVTGGGWIESRAGAYAPDPLLTGRVNFALSSKYQKDSTTPVGQTELRFNVAGLNFHSQNCQWLVVAGARAQYKGTGTINGTGDYGFFLVAIDGGTDADKFRIKIWNRATDTVVYDNQSGERDNSGLATALSGGSIVIHATSHLHD